MQIELKPIAKDKEVDLNNTLQQIKAEHNPHKQRLKQLEGQCKIHSFRPLQFDVLKTVLLIIPIILSVVCLLLLKYYRKFRVKCFYKDCSSDEATYFFIESSDGHQDIEEVIKENDDTCVFFKSLKYRLENKDLIPVGYRFYENFTTVSSNEYISYGLSDNIRSNNQKIFGRNEHLVKTPSYPEYMFDILTKPFFLLQYVICIIFAFERLYTFVAIYLIFSFITTTINYIMLYFSFKKIKDIAQKETDVQVIRMGERRTVKNHDLVPGDVVIPNKNEEICFDGILIEGEVFVNEASLTGQSIPVGKFPAKQLSKTSQQNVWLYEGAKVLQARQESRIVVVNVGYATRRGRIIRKILSRVPKIPDFLVSVVYLLFQTCIVGILIYLGTLHIMIKNDIVVAFVVFRFLDILAWSFPPSFPIYFNLCYSLSLARLKKHNIFGTEPEKATEASNVRTFCFDKTGTLTQNAIEVYQIIKFVDQANHQKITDSLNNPQNSLIRKLFSSCHTTRQTEEGLLGDQVDLRMYLASEYKMVQPSDPKIRFIVQNEDEKIEVLRINQFESKFQNMSVFVRDTKTNKYYVFVKGAPERIQRNSKVKFIFFDTLVANLSLGGYRTIGYGYKEVSQTQIKSYLQGQREVFETNITALGVVAFENKLKPDTRETIDKLIQSDIEPKMITGDNIFIAVETGYRAGIIRIEDKVVLIEGRKQKKYQKGVISGILLYKNQHQIIQSEIQMTVQQYANSEYSMAIDNDFLLLQPAPQIVRQLKLFARISPQNKALIVRRFKDQEQTAYDELPWSDRTFGRGKWKVGMCGDGANDLMAIREADVGLGISDSDASYGASFTIINMLDVDLVVRQSKNASQTIVDTIRYFGTFSFLKIITAVIMVSDVTYFGANQITYFNFAYSIWVPVVISLSASAPLPTKKRPNANLLSLENQVLYWTNIIFPTIGFIGAYYFFHATPAFYPNPYPIVTVAKGYTGIQCPTSTIIWLLLNVPMVYNAIIIYNSSPYKVKFYQNTLLLILTIVNVIPAIAFFFITNKLQKSFLTAPLPYLQSGISLLIMVVVLSVSWMFQEFLKNKCFK